MKNKCLYCGHEQITKSTLKKITCSSCGKKTPNGVINIIKIKEAVD